MECSNCGSKLNEGAKFCPDCGTMVMEKVEIAETDICVKCGNSIEANVLFCNNCGHRVRGEQTIVEKTIKHCPKCNSPINEGAKFCRKCGTQLDENTPQPQSVNVKNVPKEKKGNGWVFLVVLLIVALIGSVSVASCLYFQDVFSGIGETKEITKKETTKGTTKDTTKDTQKGTKKGIEEKGLKEEKSEPTINPIVTEDEEKYLFPSDREYITEYALYGKTKDEVAMIRNEIYARHGYMFQTEPFKSYFESQEWYVPNANFNESFFSEIEKANKDFLVEYEKSRGWR